MSYLLKNIINSNLKFIGSLKLIQQFFIGDINNFNENVIGVTGNMKDIKKLKHESSYLLKKIKQQC